MGDRAVQVVAGASATVEVPLSGSGTGTVTYYAVDRAGNAESPNGIALKWDNIAPSLTHSLFPTPNAAGWNVDNTTVHFIAKDDDSGSGVDSATVTPDYTVNVETAGKTGASMMTATIRP